MHNGLLKKILLTSVLATIFMGYILVFLVCHSPRLMLNIYELFTIRQAMECQSVGLDAFPLWPQVNLLLLSVNFLRQVSYDHEIIDEFDAGLRGLLGALPRAQLLHQHPHLQPAQLKVPGGGRQGSGDTKKDEMLQKRPNTVEWIIGRDNKDTMQRLSFVITG